MKHSGYDYVTTEKMNKIHVYHVDDIKDEAATKRQTVV